jgi:FRG domain-containing protein
VFRGLADASWSLMTSLERLGPPPDKIEEPALRAFGKYLPAGTFLHQSEWERIAVAQHNGLPTRVLDWTVSPLIAAHFATAERDYAAVDGVIWCVDVGILRDNLLPKAMLQQLRDELAWVYDVRLLDKVFPRLSDFDATHGLAGDVMIMLEPPSIDARIQNQFGILSAMNGPSRSHDVYLRKCSQTYPDLVRRVIIAHAAKPEIRDMLDQNNITERMLFPGLPGLCDWLRRYYGLA